jgi:thioester reductase-like protein
MPGVSPKLGYASNPMADDVVLVTGCPSLLARSVCSEILRQDRRASVRALVKSSHMAEAALWRGELGDDRPARVALVEGDPSSIDLGLSGLEFRALAAEVTRIHHCAQVTHWGVDRRTAERMNLGAAEEALEFASYCKGLERLVFHSMAGVSGNRTGIVREEELKAGQSFRNVVEETKARAEKVMRTAMNRLPITVVRPTTTVGDSATGEVDRFDGPYLLILLLVAAPPDWALPLPGRGDEPLNLVPVDWVARASVALGRLPQALGCTLHLADSRPVSVRTVFELVARAGGRPEPRGSIPTRLAKALLRTPGLDRFATSPRALLDAVTSAVTYDTRVARELLASVDVGPCPPFASYVERIVDYVAQRSRQYASWRRRATVEPQGPLA